MKQHRYICRLSITYSDSNNPNSTTKNAHMNLGTIIIRLFPKRVILHESPLSFLELLPQYTIIEDQNKQITVSGSIEAIVSQA